MFLKRLLLVLPVVCVSINANAANTCGPLRVNYLGLQEPADDEFLYETEREFKLSLKGYDNSNHSNSGDGYAYECDNEHCKNETRVQMKSGHVFKGKVIYHKATYKCNAPWMAGNDRWTEIDEGNCIFQDDVIHVGNHHKKIFSFEDCSGLQKNDLNGVEYYLWCREGPGLICEVSKCKNGYELKNGKCVTKPNIVPPVVPDPNKKTCRQKRSPSIEGMACCDLSSSEATWNGKSCVCTDSSKEFRIEHGKGVCADKGSVQEPKKCDCTANISIISNATAACGASDASIAQAITDIKAQCNRGADCDADVFDFNINIINEAIATCNIGNQDNDEHGSLKLITGYVSAIDSYVSGLDVSVWKNAEGKFNTSRLASDSIAGVVLGTVGGVVTSTVVKKNQIKNGFEDVYCSISGQEVGGYGDEISVGVK